MSTQDEISLEQPSPKSPQSLALPPASPEPERRTRKTNKGNSVVEKEDNFDSLCQSRKRGHNAIEKRYRTNLNDKINCLKQGVPSLIISGAGSQSGEKEQESNADGENIKSGQQRYGKADIIVTALDYIKHLESTTQRLGNEVHSLTTRVGAFEDLAINGSVFLNGTKNFSRRNQRGNLSSKSETLADVQAGKLILYICSPIIETNIQLQNFNN
jgi:hypothetical protein